MTEAGAYIITKSCRQTRSAFRRAGTSESDAEHLTEQRVDERGSKVGTHGSAAPGSRGRALSRRAFLAGAASAGAGLAWRPLFRIPASAADDGFPPAIERYQQAYENWAGAIRVDDAWTCAPASADDVVALADWAADHGWRLRARGAMHNWSPLVISEGETVPVLLVDTTQHLTTMALEAGGTRVRAQTGVLVEDLLAFLEANGAGVTATPAPGDITVGGVLAIDGHGAAIPARGESRGPGGTFGSLSNLVLELTAVVYDSTSGRYTLRTFNRRDPAIAPLLVHLGRAFVTEVVLQVGPNTNLRCVSSVHLSAAELFAAPGTAGRTFASYLDAAGRVEAIWYPHTEKPWLKVWSVAPTQPVTSRAVSGPYNYPFSDNIPREIAALADEIVSGHPEVTPQFGQMMYDFTLAGLTATQSFDLWGPSKNLLLYIKPSTLRVTANGYAVLTRRNLVQQAVSDFVAKYTDLVAAYAAQGRYPMSMPVEIRCTGLDRPSEVDLKGAVAPALSALTPRQDHPEWDVAVWFDTLTFPDTPHASEFYAELESWMFSHFRGSSWCVRPEWSKGWGYTAARGPWSSADVLARIPRMYRDSWYSARDRLAALDPHRVFTNDFLDRLFG